MNHKIFYPARITVGVGFEFYMDKNNPLKVGDWVSLWCSKDKNGNEVIDCQAEVYFVSDTTDGLCAAVVS